MSSSTWTPDALSSSAAPTNGDCWRLVEAQHRVSTLKLVDDLEEQEVLEKLVEEVKPRIPKECQHLHYLLSTPFRYGAPYPIGSRFRRAGMTEGVYYASERVETAVAELSFHRLLFFAESPATLWPSNPAEYTSFSATFDTISCIDLTRPPFDVDRESWCQLEDYEPCQDLADAARLGGIEVIRYESVRDPGQGINLALLTCRAFSVMEPTGMQTWRMHLSRSGVQAICEFPDIRISFDRDTFIEDPRIAGMKWDR